MVPKQQLATLPKFDGQDKYSVTNTRPENNVMRTTSEQAIVRRY